MTDIVNMPEQQPKLKRESLWSKAFKKFSHDRIGLISLFVVLIYMGIAIAVWLGWLGNGWDQMITNGYQGPSAAHWFGTNINGQDIFARAMYSTKTAFSVGIIVACSATFIGAITGALMGYFNSTVIDEFIMWIMNCLDCIPFYLLVAAIAFALPDNTYSMHIAMTATFWTGTARVVRGEMIKLKNMEFTEAARALGVPTYKIIFKHLLPNTSHIILVNMSLLFISAIKAEVILSFLGIGVKNGISWGLMLAAAGGEVTGGHFCNFFAASGMLFVLVLAFNMFSDSLQDALDPRTV
ncbi:ABC transporter permease [Celerinatantimonas yamalensis]|uniref:ABC transporter permease n=1 Tax=Celerinatantimonas yamalensis TaxID=559956 RepID=A0ABW9G4B2_9GAMM